MRVDFVIVGAGILGLAIAKELTRQFPQQQIMVIDKEPEIGLHASGRNSGILHAGIYYKPGSLKAKFCLEGLRAMANYCKERALPLNPIGKLIIPTQINEGETLHLLYQRALQNGAKATLIDKQQLSKMEPLVQSATGEALYSEETSVVSPKAILTALFKELSEKQVTFCFNERVQKINVHEQSLWVNQQKVSYGHLFNTAGLYADKIASACELPCQYTMIPFKGMYYEFKPEVSLELNHLIYPVPDMNVPFLGIHLTKTIENKIYIGPTAIPVLGREHYRGLKGIKLLETLETMHKLSGLYFKNQQGFRHYAHQEIPRFLKSRFIASAKSLLPAIQPNEIIRSKKVGIRAQLFDKFKKELPMDFIIENTTHETHILNAVSPAFTSSFPFSQYVVEQFC